ncbi:MAG: hypothetical protein O3A15_00070 [Proteobacteria bacterium]|jgi:hypothetical protein|nr:hypothetical protein [Pseudomonadota bacterium]
MEEDNSLNSIVDPVYVVTRDGRRVEPTNYVKKSEAVERSKSLIKMVKEFDKSFCPNIVSIKKTTSPHYIR